MAFEKLSSSVDNLNSNIQSLVKSNSEYYKLKTFKQGMKGVTSLVRFLIMVTILSVAGLLISIALAILISQTIGIPSSGFFIIGGIYLVVVVLIYFFGKEPIEKLLLKKFSEIIFNEKNTR